jgi:hypothetical protein
VQRLVVSVLHAWLDGQLHMYLHALEIVSSQLDVWKRGGSLPSGSLVSCHLYLCCAGTPSIQALSREDMENSSQTTQLYQHDSSQGAKR